MVRCVSRQALRHLTRHLTLISERGWFGRFWVELPHRVTDHVRKRSWVLPVHTAEVLRLSLVFAWASSHCIVIPKSATDTPSH
jgi:hypothetical protein